MNADTDPLQSFYTWFLSPSGPGVKSIPALHALRQRDGLTAVTLYRRNVYQAELFFGSGDASYRLTVPEGYRYSFFFLSGNISYHISGGVNLPSPQDFQEELEIMAHYPDASERPHPMVGRQAYHCFEGGSIVSFNFPRQAGILVAFSMRPDGKDHSCLDHMEVIISEEEQL